MYLIYCILITWLTPVSVHVSNSLCTYNLYNTCEYMYLIHYVLITSLTPLCIYLYVFRSMHIICATSVWLHVSNSLHNTCMCTCTCIIIYWCCNVYQQFLTNPMHRKYLYLMIKLNKVCLHFSHITYFRFQFTFF